jgi:mannose/cellobiose epimerase-like protein (N-acyl-D-glucosamine 2-epimerase family)
VEWTQKALAKSFPTRDAQAYAVLAMAQYQLKQTDEARATLAKGLKIADEKMRDLDHGDLGGNWSDWVIAHALLKEAEALIPFPK